MDKNSIHIPKITSAYTKKEMLEAYNVLKKRFESQARAEMQPKKVQQARKEKEAVTAAEDVVSENLSTRIDALKHGITKSLVEIADKLEKETARYSKIKAAIDIKSRELEEIFEIEKSAFSLTALLEAQKLKKAEFEAHMTDQRESWAREKKEHTERVKEQRTAEEKQRLREKEEYEYRFKREKQQKTRQLEDEIQQLEKTLQDKREAFDKEIAEKENDLLQRDLAVSEREKRMDDLEKQVAAFPKELESAVQSAVKDATGRVQADAAKNEELINKEFEGHKNVLETKIESLDKVLVSQKKQIEALTAMLDNAYGKVQDIAVTAVSRPQRAAPSLNETDAASPGSR